MKLIRVTTIAGSLGLLKGQLKYMSENGIEVVAVADNSAARKPGAKGDDLAQIAETEGVRTVEVPMHREISPLADLKSLWQLYHLFKKEKPDVVHANTPKAALLSMLAAKAAEVKHRIYLVTGLRFETTTGAFRKLLKSMERLSCACATKVIPEGQGVKKTLLREGITDKPMEVLHYGNINGIDLSYHHPDAVAAAEQAPKDTFNFIFIGRMVKDKGIHELVDAFVKINEIFPQTRLILLGRFEPKFDPIAPETANIIKTHPAIVCPGYQNDVRPWLKASNVLVHPSYREGFANVILEAGAMGLPCIVTDINGSNEAIVDGKNGLIVPTHDAESIFNAMQSMIADPEATGRMAAVARQMIADRFDRNDVHKAILEMYENL